MTFPYYYLHFLSTLTRKTLILTTVAIGFFPTVIYGQISTGIIPPVINFLLDEEEAEVALAWVNFSNKVFLYGLESEVKTDISPSTGTAGFSIAYNSATNNILYDTGSNTVVNYDLKTEAGADIATDLDNSFGLAVDDDTGKVYWSEFSLDEIWQMDADGSNKEKLADVNVSPSGLVVDTVNKHIYYMTYNSTAVYRIDLATGLNPTTIQSTLGGQGIAIAVNPAANKLYYTTRAKDVFVSDLDGQNAAALIEDQGAVQGMDIDVENNKIYWIDALDGVIRSANLDDGSDIQDVTTTDGNGWHLTVVD